MLGRFEPALLAMFAAFDGARGRRVAPFDPRNGYAATKVAQEHLAATWATVTDGHGVALRYHNVYGRRLPRDTPYAGVAALFRSALARGVAPRVFEDGGQLRDFVHVRDVARANLLALDHEGPGRARRVQRGQRSAEHRGSAGRGSVRCACRATAGGDRGVPSG